VRLSVFERIHFRPYTLAYRVLSLSIILHSCSGNALCAEIHQAVDRCDLNAVKTLINANPQLLFSRDVDGDTPLHRAVLYCDNGDTNSVAESLIEMGAPINAQNNHGETPIHIAAVKHIQPASAALRVLIANGADVNARNNAGETPLHLAALSQNEEAERALLMAHADVTAKNRNGAEPLHYAAEGCGLGLGPLVEYKADLNDRDNNGDTPLHFAAANDSCLGGHLLERGADANARDNNNWTPLQYAVLYAREKEPRALGDSTLAQLLAHGADVNTRAFSTPLLGPRVVDVKSYCSQFVSYGGYPHSCLPDRMLGWTALHIAAELEEEEVVGLLLQRHADVNARDEYGITPLILVSRAFELYDFPKKSALALRRRIAEALLSSGADPNLLPWNHMSTLLMAVNDDDVSLMKLLIKYGASTDSKAEEGITLLMASAIAGKPAATEFLLKIGADPNARDTHGNTALVWAIGYLDWGSPPPDEFSKRKHIARILIAKTNVNTRNSRGHTPLFELKQHSCYARHAAIGRAPKADSSCEDVGETLIAAGAHD
jgi:ankyrin repeat protein